MPVVTFPMKERFGVAVHISSRVISHHALLLIVQGDEEGSFFNAVQRSLVDPRAEELLPGLSPWNSRKLIRFQILALRALCGVLAKGAEPSKAFLDSNV